MKRFITVILVLAMALTCFAGCANAPEEETASTGEYVAGDSSKNRPAEGNGPVKVENQNGGSVTEYRENTGDTAQGGTNEGSNGAASSDNKQSDRQGGAEGTNQQTPGKTDNEGGEEDPKVEYNPQNKLKIVSYNLRYTDDGGELDIDRRAPRLKTVLAAYDPDIIGFQEVVPKWLDQFLIPYYAISYDYIMKYRSATNKEGTPLFWKKDKFNCLENGYFWLSESPETEGMIGWGQGLPRICMWAKLEVKATGKVFLFYNTHYEGSNAVNSSKLIISRAQKQGGFKKYAVISTADYNMTPWSDGYVAMLDKFYDLNDMTVQSNQYTGHGYRDTGGIIDFIFCSPEFTTPLTYKVLTEKPDGQFVSDHFGIYGEVALT